MDEHCTRISVKFEYPADFGDISKETSVDLHDPHWRALSRPQLPSKRSHGAEEIAELYSSSYSLNLPLNIE